MKQSWFFMPAFYWLTHYLSSERFIVTILHGVDTLLLQSLIKHQNVNDSDPKSNSATAIEYWVKV